MKSKLYYLLPTIAGLVFWAAGSTSMAQSETLSNAVVDRVSAEHAADVKSGAVPEKKATNVGSKSKASTKSERAGQVAKKLKTTPPKPIPKKKG